MASFWLEFDQGGQLQQASFDKESVSIGRDRGSDFVLDHPTVSRQHALIVSDGGGRFRLVVLSRGGLTAVDGQEAQKSEIQLYDQTSIQLGKYQVRFRSPEAPPKPSSSGAQTTKANSNQRGQGQPMAASPSAPNPESSAGAGANNSFGNSFSGAEQPANTGQSSGDFGAGFQGGMGADGPAEAPAPDKDDEASDDGGAGIKSWDEIAADSEREEADKKAEQEQRDAPVSQFKKVRKSGDDEETSPVILIGGILAAVVLLGVAFLADSDDEHHQQQREQVRITEQTPVEIATDCYDDRSCREEAEQHYARGIDLIEQRAIETGNLFEGYRRLLKAEAYLQEAGVEEIPADWDQWEEFHDEARAYLNNQFSQYRMQFHQAQQNHEYHRMADIIEDIEANFPDRTARERQWSRSKEREMQAQGVYPRR